MNSLPPIPDAPVRQPRYTFNWLVCHLLFAVGAAVGFTIIAEGISEYASSRVSDELLNPGRYALLSQAANYCFALVLITISSLSLIEVAVRRPITYGQYFLIGCALALFYLLLLAMAEKMLFVAAYCVVSAMTIGLVTWFVFAITRRAKAAIGAIVLLVFEYGLLYMLVSLGDMALLVGSLLLFVIIAVAMALSLKLKIRNEEIYLS